MLSSQNGPVVSYDVWLAALASSACIGFTSLVPWLFNMTFFERGSDDGRMKFLLSFAVGAILGDIFFHLIPESFQSHLVELNDSKVTAHQNIGLSVIAGIFMFIIVEMILEKWSNHDDERQDTAAAKYVGKEINEQTTPQNAQIPIFSNKDLKQTIRTPDKDYKFLENNNNVWTDLNSSNIIDQHLKLRKKSCSNGAEIENSSILDTSRNIDVVKPTGCQIIDTAGYLNLIANGFDNFTHGLAIGASFLVGPKVGLLTTFVIFIHEIPHEICDYAILVNSGFSRWDAVKAQSSVSLFGILGTATALYVKSVQILNAKTVWILPFSAGGFLYIALVNILPEILDQQADLRNSLGQISCVILGIAFMATVAFI